jgi:hypothetical protein
MTPTAPTEQDIAAQIRRIGAAHKDYYEAASALLAYARVGTDIREMIHRLNKAITAAEVLTRACEAIPESLGLLRGEQFPGIIDINEEDIHVEEEDPS